MDLTDQIRGGCTAAYSLTDAQVEGTLRWPSASAPRLTSLCLGAEDTLPLAVTALTGLQVSSHLTQEAAWPYQMGHAACIRHHACVHPIQHRPIAGAAQRLRIIIRRTTTPCLRLNHTLVLAHVTLARSIASCPTYRLLASIHRSWRSRSSMAAPKTEVNRQTQLPKYLSRLARLMRLDIADQESTRVPVPGLCNGACATMLCFVGVAMGTALCAFVIAA